MNLQQKKWLYFVILFTSCGIAGIMFERFLSNNTSGMLYGSIAMLITAIASFIQWRAIVKKMKS